MKRRSYIYLCNAIEEDVCRQRKIISDSPAATKKVLDVARALRHAGIPVVVLSMGRGRQQGSGTLHPAIVRRVGGVPVAYAPFLDYPLLTHAWTMFGLAGLLFYLLRKNSCRGVIAYNRLAHYLPALELARLFRMRCLLDLEDGDVNVPRSRILKVLGVLLRERINCICSGGALLANSFLKTQYSGTRTMTCYGVAQPSSLRPTRLPNSRLTIHIGGSLQPDTGAEMLIGAIKLLRNRTSYYDLHFIVTGFGSSAQGLQALQSAQKQPTLEFLGRVDRKRYLDVLARSDASMALKLSSGQYADTTFPSKVIEIASAGLMLISTRINDVPSLFGEDGAVYVDDESPEGLARVLARVAKHDFPLEQVARCGQLRIARACSEENVSKELSALLDAVSERKP